ncbi:MAG: acyltransferase [Chloroflexi bacterium]|nr:acyltransferase [Chloroflexota bacterium]
MERAGVRVAAGFDPVTGLAPSREAVGAGRVRAFDLARGLAVVFMILVHVLFHWGRPETWSTLIGTVVSFLGGPLAMPVFMFLMGASLAFSSRSSFSSLALRGLWLVWLGYLLNILRGTLPATLAMEVGIVTQGQIDPFTPWWLLSTVDVHHMAGLSLLTIALLRLGSKPSWTWVALGVAVVAVTPLVRGLSFGTPLLDAPLTPVWGDAPNVYYALMPWVVYPLVGAVFGMYVARARDRVATFRRAGALGAVLCAVGGAWILVDPPGFDINTYWRQPAQMVVGIMGVVFLWAWLCEVVTRRVPANRAFDVVYGWSGRVIAMYFAHWLIVTWSIGLIGFRSLSLEAVLVGMVVAVALTAYVSRPRPRLAALAWVHAPWAAWAHRRHLAERVVVPDAERA